MKRTDYAILLIFVLLLISSICDLYHNYVHRQQRQQLHIIEQRVDSIALDLYD